MVNLNIFCSLIFSFFTLFFYAQTQEPSNKSIVLKATIDFTTLSVEGFVPATNKGGRKVLSVNAGKYKDKYAAAQSIFTGASGSYDIAINTLKEFDGESTYRIRIDGKLVGEYQNPRTDKDGDFSPAGTTFKNINVEKGDIVQVEFNSHTNGLIPEHGGTAYARGRWSSLVFNAVIQ